MSTAQTPRWQQRFAAFDKAFRFLERVVANGADDEVVRTATVKAFEMSFEAGWKTLKDYLYLQGHTPAFTRDVLRTGFQTGVIADGHIWIQMLEVRNEMVHNYDEQDAIEVAGDIRAMYVDAIRQLHSYFQSLMP